MSKWIVHVYHAMSTVLGYICVSNFSKPCREYCTLCISTSHTIQWLTNLAHRMYVHTQIQWRLRIYFIVYMIVPLHAHGHDRMIEAEWLISGTLSTCDERRQLDRGETLSLKKKEKQGFASEGWQRWDAETEEDYALKRHRGEMLTLKTNEKLGFTGDDRWT